MSEANELDDMLRHGVALGDRRALWQAAEAAGVSELNEAAWPLPEVAVGGAADAVVRGMFEMVANHLRSPQARAAFAPLQLLVVLRGDLSQFTAWVMALDDTEPRPQQYLMLLRPAVFTTVADRLLRALTCAEVWPELGDLSSCQTQWVPEPLANQPHDPERFQLAMNMAMMAGLMIFYHELAHILRGHSAYWATRPQVPKQSGMGMVALRENHPLGITNGSSVNPDLVRRALEVDADIYAGHFVASLLKLGALYEVSDESLPQWCELLGFVATLTFNAFEAHAMQAGYAEGYHLPSSRTECFLEGAARGLGVSTPDDFIPGANAGFEFCARHYQAPASLAHIEADIRSLQQDTWPVLSDLRAAFGEHVPPEWLVRAGTEVQA